MIGDTTVRPSRMRKAVIRTVTASAAVPLYAVVADVDARPAIQVRSRLHDLLGQVSLADLVHLAIARTLPEHPLLNSSYAEGEIVRHSAVNLAVIVEADDGMLAPVLRKADQRSLSELARCRREMVDQAQRGTLAWEALEEPTFTVSNLGGYGIHSFTAMVLPPQAAILAIGAVSRDDHWRLTLSVDHRVVDGAPAARFLRQLSERLADQEWLRSVAETEAAA